MSVAGRRLYLRSECLDLTTFSVFHKCFEQGYNPSPATHLVIGHFIGNWKLVIGNF
jgi:hypothetical protein